jgi:hypothetical protein
VWLDAIINRKNRVTGSLFPDVKKAKISVFLIILHYLCNLIKAAHRPATPVCGTMIYEFSD